MRARVTIRVSYDATSYEEAGRILDQIMAPAGQLKQYKGHADVVGFETTPCKQLEYDRIERDGGEALMAPIEAVDGRY